MPTTISTSYSAGTTIVVTVTLTDEDSSAVTPNEASWSLYRSGAVVNSREDVEIDAGDLASSMDIVLQGDDLVAGLLYFVIAGTYDSTAGTDLPFRDWAEITIKDALGAG